MTNLNPEICLKLRDARRAAKLSQSELAREVGCKQSALSMFEQGQPTKLNDDIVEKLAKKFGVKLVEEGEKGVEAYMPFGGAAFEYGFSGAAILRGFCPNPRCPSNRAFQVDGRTLYLPKREEADPVGAKFCAICGEVLEKRCPNCGAAVHAGAICSHCGEPYLSV